MTGTVSRILTVSLLFLAACSGSEATGVVPTGVETTEVEIPDVVVITQPPGNGLVTCRASEDLPAGGPSVDADYFDPDGNGDCEALINAAADQVPPALADERSAAVVVAVTTCDQIQLEPQQIWTTGRADQVWLAEQLAAANCPGDPSVYRLQLTDPWALTPLCADIVEGAGVARGLLGCAQGVEPSGAVPIDVIDSVIEECAEGRRHELALPDGSVATGIEGDRWSIATEVACG